MRPLIFRLLFILLSAVIFFGCDTDKSAKRLIGHSYFLSADGDNEQEGSREKPWRSLSKANAVRFQAGDTLFLQGGASFNGTLILDKDDFGAQDAPVVITSHGSQTAIIQSANDAAVAVDGSAYITFVRLHVIGSGRKNGNTKNGIELKNGTGFVVDEIEAEGFQKSGVTVQTSSKSILDHIYAHDNGAAGIFITGNSAKTDCHDIVVRNSRAENNPGDPTNLTNHSGNGILAGFCRKVTIEYCSASNNGWDMPRIGNGPVGIWTYESDSVLIQHCISFRNKTSKGADDGGGFDLDGGVTNSIIQYCLTYENEGSGFGIFQYAGASRWNNNTIRFCISENDGNVSPAKAGVYIWNGSAIAKDFSNCYFYNNTVYNKNQAAISYSPLNARSNFQFYNNIFIGRDGLIRGDHGSDKFLGNDWRSLQNTFSIDAITDFNKWVAQSGQETYHNQIVGFNTLPEFKNYSSANLSSPQQLKTFLNYALPANSVLRDGGIDLKKEFGITTGKLDFNGNEHQQLVGASY